MGVFNEPKKLRIRRTTDGNVTFVNGAGGSTAIRKISLQGKVFTTGSASLPIRQVTTNTKLFNQTTQGLRGEKGATGSPGAGLDTIQIDIPPNTTVVADSIPGTEVNSCSWDTHIRVLTEQKSKSLLIKGHHNGIKANSSGWEVLGDKFPVTHKVELLSGNLELSFTNSYINHVRISITRTITREV